MGCDRAHTAGHRWHYDRCSVADLTVGPTRPRSPEVRASQDGPRDTEEDRPELGRSGDRSRSTEEAVLGNGERRSSRNVDDGLPGRDRIHWSEGSLVRKVWNVVLVNTASRNFPVCLCTH